MILATNIVPHYTLLALGSVRFVSVVNVLGGILSLVAVALFVPHLGMVGAAIGRLLYGAVTVLNLLRVKAKLARSASPRQDVVLIST